MARIKFELTFDTESGNFSVVNTETGEIQEVAVKTAKKATKSAKKDDGDPTPKIIRDENKLILNNAAADLLLTEGEENKLVVKYMKYGNVTVPTISLGDGNKVTKSLTVAFRGKNNVELAKYGTEFTLAPYPGKSGVYIMNSGEQAPEIPSGDENFSIPEEDNTIETTPVVTDNDDLDLSDLLGDGSNDTEVSSLDFSL